MLFNHEWTQRDTNEDGPAKEGAGGSLMGDGRSPRIIPSFTRVFVCIRVHSWFPAPSFRMITVHADPRHPRNPWANCITVAGTG
jgi:hypothetical protein